MPTPAEAHEVVNALRMGWYVAEIRGRSRPGGPRPPGDQLPDRRNHVLPLRIERTADELGFEAHAVLQQLSGELCVDTFTLKEVQSRTAIIDQQARDLAAAAPQTEEADQAWNALAASIYELDAHAQDTLTAKSEIQAAAYQLGRGLAEVYWALDPDAPGVPLTAECWEFLLGQHRCQELTRLAGRLSGYLNPYGPPAIAGTLCLWQLVAKDPQWRNGAQDHLYQQLRRWYELLILGQDPSTLIQPYALLKNWQVSLHALSALKVQLITVAISLGLVIALITLIASGSANAFLKALFGVLGVAGLSIATAQARLKATAQGLLNRLRQDAYTDLVAVAIAEAPDKPNARNPRKVVVAEVRKRTLTTIADAAVP